MDFFWSNIADRSALLVAEDHVEHYLLRSRTNGRRGGLWGLLGWPLGRQARCIQQKCREKDEQPVHGRDLLPGQSRNNVIRSEERRVGKSVGISDGCGSKKRRV